MRILAPAIALCLAVAGATAGLCQGNDRLALPPTPARGQPPSDIKVPLIDHGLSLADFAGMQPRPELREKLAAITGFIQNKPNDGEPATEKTEVWMAHTQIALYIVFVCHDHRPAGIRGHLARRENVLSDDNVSLLLDPFQDRRKGILFTVNSAGVQADASWSELNGADYSYDQVWDSEAA